MHKNRNISARDYKTHGMVFENFMACLQYKNQVIHKNLILINIVINIYFDGFWFSNFVHVRAELQGVEKSIKMRRKDRAKPDPRLFA